MADKYLLDTSALMAFLEKEPGGDRVEQLLEAGQRGEVELFAAFASRMELLYFLPARPRRDKTSTHSTQSEH